MRIRGGFLTAVLFVLSSAIVASAQPPPPPQVGSTLPPGFPAIENPYLGVPILGFGARGFVRHVPIIFLHGNNDSPFPTTCNQYYGKVQAFAQYFADHGYQLSELWALGYQGDQCDLLADETLRSGVAHGTAAAVSLLRKFVAGVMAYTHAPQVDIVAHSLGVTVAREWMLEDNAYGRVRRLVAIDGPNHGITDCSPAAGNYFQLLADGDFVPNSSICEEYGAADTPFLTALNAAGETPGPTQYLVIRNVFEAMPESGDFVYIGGEQDGLFPPVPAEDRNGNAHDFSGSALLNGAQSIDLTEQGAFDAIAGTAHLGILNSPTTWADTFNFVSQDYIALPF
jgi:pimeloyl-ACP methyl ester carboxylesterase